MKAREPRRTVLISARMKTDAEWCDVRIHNVSAHGMLVETPDPPPRGTYVDIRRAHHVMIGRAMWRKGSHFGVRLQDALDVAALVGDAATGVKRPAEGANDRRQTSRVDPGVAIARRIERSRSIASALQFMLIAAAGFAAAALAASEVYRLLAVPIRAVQNGMSAH